MCAPLDVHLPFGPSELVGSSSSRLLPASNSALDSSHCTFLELAMDRRPGAPTELLAMPSPRLPARGILVRTPSSDCVAKRCVKWASCDPQVFEVEEWDRSPCPVTPKLTYRSVPHPRELLKIYLTLFLSSIAFLVHATHFSATEPTCSSFLCVCTAEFSHFSFNVRPGCM